MFRFHFWGSAGQRWYYVCGQELLRLADTCIVLGGNYPCYNVVGDCCFDLTSEQFGDEAKDLVYENNPDQYREIHFSLDERKEFFLLYDMLIQGEDVWYNRVAVCELLNYLSAINFSSDLRMGSVSTHSSTFDEVKEGLIEGEYSIQNMFYALLSREASSDPGSCFQLFLPSGTDLNRIFMQLWHNGMQFSVTQLFCFPTAVNNDYSKSVRILQQIIPMCFSAGGSYHPYYFYETPAFLSVSPLNYYVITPHYLILLSQDQSRAFVQKSDRLRKLFAEHFNSLIAYCEPLISYFKSLLEILDSCSAMINPKGCLYLMPQPCFGRYFTPEIITKYLRQDSSFMENMYPAVAQYFASFQENKNDFYTVFSEEGLQRFSETGIITELPQEYVLPIDKQDRILLLSCLRDDIADHRITGRITHPSAIHIPEYLTLYIDTNGNTWFDTTSDFIHGAYYCDIHLAEKTSCHAFQDFFQCLPGSKLVYSQEETLQILDKYIYDLEITQA